MYYSSFGTLALIIALIINHDVLRAKKGGPGRISPKIKYKHFMICVLIYFVSDILWGVLYEYRLTALLYADTVVYFLAMVTSVLLWAIYVVDYLNKNNFFSKFLTVAGWVIVVFEVVALTVNFFTPFVFSISEKPEYVPGNARFITLAAQVVLFLSVSVYTLSAAARAEGKDKRHCRTIGYSGIVMTTFIILQTFYPLAPYYSVGCLIAICLVHAFITEGERTDRNIELGTAKHKAYTDSLTGVKNSHAYAEAKTLIERRLADGSLTEFGVVVFDLNGLKAVNDTLGHEAGDKLIEDGCHLICEKFKHSPVFRIGGDEFVALLEGDDYRDRASLMESFDIQAEKNAREGLVVVAGGLGEFIPGEDNDYDAVFERADHRMYKRKKELKENKGE